MNRTSIIFLLALLTMTLPLAVAAQTDLPGDASFLSGDQKLVRMAIDSSLCILRQEYTLTNRNGNEYGRNGKSYFGRAYALGVLAGNRIWTVSRIRRPWEMDGNYEKFRSIDSIKPRLSGTYARQVVRSGYAAVKEDSSFRHQNDDSALTVYQSPDTLPQVALVTHYQDRGGWLIIVAGREPMGVNDTLPVSYTIYKVQPQFADPEATKAYIRNIPVKENVIGGIFFASMVRVGKITFAAAGILEKDKTGWYIQLFPGSKEIKKAESLTPLKNSNNLR